MKMIQIYTSVYIHIIIFKNYNQSLPRALEILAVNLFYMCFFNFQNWIDMLYSR